MINLKLPQLDEESKDTKDIVFTTLTKEQPLSIMELYKRIKKENNLRITYQAVRKAVNNLQGEEVLIKEGKKYSLNKNWIINLKNFLDNLLVNYDKSTKIHEFNEEVAKENYAVYTFNNLLDLDNFWGEFMVHWAKKNKGKEHFALGYGDYAWWMLINLGRETKTINAFVENKIPLHFILCKKLPLNVWANKIYRDLGIKSRVINRKGSEENVGVNIYDDLVVQVKYDDKILERISKIFKKYKKIEEISLKEITEMAHMNCEVKFIIFKNRSIANELREKYLKFS